MQNVSSDLHHERYGEALYAGRAAAWWHLMIDSSLS